MIINDMQYYGFSFDRAKFFCAFQFAQKPSASKKWHWQLRSFDNKRYSIDSKRIVPFNRIVSENN